MSILDEEKFNALKLTDKTIDEYESESVDPRIQVYIKTQSLRKINRFNQFVIF